MPALKERKNALQDLKAKKTPALIAEVQIIWLMGLIATS